MRNFRKVDVSAATVCLWLGFTAWVTYSVFINNEILIYAENGLLENIQAYLLGIACLVFLATTVFEKHFAKLILLFCALLCYTFLLRELDVEHFDIPPAIKFLGHGMGRNTVVAVALFAILLPAALKSSYYLAAMMRFAKSRAARLLMTGGVFLLLGDLFDKKVVDTTHYVFFEEMAEIAGYVLILLSAMASNSYLARTADHGIWPRQATTVAGHFVPVAVIMASEPHISLQPLPTTLDGFKGSGTTIGTADIGAASPSGR